MLPREVALDAPEARPLLEGLEAEYASRYGENDELSAYDPEAFSPPCGLFLLVEEDGEAVAGGGLRQLHPGVGEIKRMWTAEHARRRGHARRVLTLLQDAALARGYRRLVLETGTEQPEAVELYGAAGYSRSPTTAAIARIRGASAWGRTWRSSGVQSRVADRPGPGPGPNPEPVLVSARGRTSFFRGAIRR